MWSDLVHPMALHAAIQGFAVLLIRGDRIELRYRYESWVQYQSQRRPSRVDLSAVWPRAHRARAGRADWVVRRCPALTPALHVTGGGATGLDAGRDPRPRRTGHADAPTRLGPVSPASA